MIAFTSTLAENVNSKVRQLDLAKSHVSDCMKRVKDILDVKFCTDGVQTALQNEDFEQAAAHIHRFLSLDENVLRHTAQDMTEESELNVSFTVLHRAESQLRTIIVQKFDEAIHDGDLASVERFFKIFPLLNRHEEGLRKFSRFLCSRIVEAAKTNLQTALGGQVAEKRASVLFADTLTLLFEGIARTIEIQQPVIETYYGPGRLPTVIAILQKECDEQVLCILTEFGRKRQLQQKVQQVQLMSKLHLHRHLDKIEPKEIDSLLAEMALMNARVELYFRFIRRRMTSDIEIAIQDEALRQAKLLEAETLIKNSELSRSTQELFGHYILMEEFFLRESVAKAISLDVVEQGSLMSSMVDDIFFIVKKSVRRTLSSSSIDGTCAMLNNACAVLEEGFGQVLQSHIRQGLPTGLLDLAYTTVLQQGKPLASDASDKAQYTFMVMLNNVEIACEYIQTLKSSIEEEIVQHFTWISEREKGKLESCLSELEAASSRFKALLDQGMHQLVGSVVRPRVKPWVDTFLNVNHDITEEEFSNYEANDPFVQTLIVNLHGLLVSIKENLTNTNYDALISAVTNEVATQMERVVLKVSFNRLGGLQLDKEVRALMAFLAGMTSWTIRDKFARLTQITTILNLDKVTELLDYWGPNSGPLTWRLTPSEVRLVLALRVEFRSEEIRRLKL